MRCARLVLCAVVLATALVASSPTRGRASRAPSGWSIAQSATQYVGYRYAYVGDTPATGFSCTGFVAFIYRQYGYWLPEDIRVLAVRYPYVAPQNLRPGDILIFSNTVWPGYSHAAIYIGGGWMIGADNFTVGVHRDYLYDAYWYSRWTRSERVIWP